MVEAVEKIWMDGKLVNWQDANVHILTHTLHYGLGVFEGIRCYKTARGGAVFRLNEHIERLFNSAHIVRIKIPFTQNEITEAVINTILINKLDECYIRPIVYLGYGVMGLNPTDSPVKAAIVTWKWGKYLGEHGQNNGVSIKVSSFIRHHVNSSMSRAKVCGHYVNSILAKREALEDGYHEAILLDTSGFVSECSGENIFIVKNGIIKTPPATSILIGITRDTVLTIARDGGYCVKEESITRDDLYTADEVFICGTAAEITPISEIDHRIIGNSKPGKITKHIQKHYFEIVYGKDKKYDNWLTFINNN
ncbi:MAG: branched-chain amino acid transaminase [Candidatus Firestonebacteria bacterium]|nr:branched-chain amino acid transaminase [Candidatus Firestonebacteria bacterium]